MVVKKRGLNRGLDALLGAVSDKDPQVDTGDSHKLQ